MTTPEDIARVRSDIPYVTLKVKEAFDLLNSQEKMYTYHLSSASWWAYWIAAGQTSAETPALLKLFLSLNLTKTGTVELSKAALEKGVTAEEFDYFLQYVASFFTNCGNYLSFGDTKMLPRISADKMKTIISASPNAKDADLSVLEKAASFADNERMIGLAPEGLSSYFSPNVTTEDGNLIKAFMEKQNILPHNTRLWKDDDGNFEIKTCSVEVRTGETYQYEGKKITITYGDFAPYAAKMVEHFKAALKYVANEHQKAMIENYIAHYETGCMEKFKQSQREWVKDVGPIIENNIGFVETYKDPIGVRGEHAGWVACVDKQQSKLYADLVSLAPTFIETLPWGKEFEKETFIRPDFTALKIVTYGGSGVPLGINIPNFEDIRTEDGFKNVYLINVGDAASSAQTLTFLHENDASRLKVSTKDMDVQVAGHELLGHGSGRSLQENADGVKNFNADLINPLTQKPVSTWYKPGESYDSVFGPLASGWEECRAEAVGLWLSVDDKFLEHFGLTTPDAKKELIFSNWMKMARNGIRGLEFYNAEQKKWGQAHMVARHVILRVFIESGLVTVEETKDAEGKDYVYLNMDESKILTTGKEAMKTLLLHLNVHKATADVKGAQEYWNKYATVDDYWTNIRNIALAHRSARFQVIYGRPELRGDNVEFTEYGNGIENLLQSYTEILNGLN